MKMTLMGGKVECMEPNMVGVDDGVSIAAPVFLLACLGMRLYEGVQNSEAQSVKKY